MNRRSFFGLTPGGILAALCPWRRKDALGSHYDKLIMDDIVTVSGTRWHEGDIYSQIIPYHKTYTADLSSEYHGE